MVQFTATIKRFDKQAEKPVGLLFKYLLQLHKR